MKLSLLLYGEYGRPIVDVSLLATGYLLIFVHVLHIAKVKKVLYIIIADWLKSLISFHVL